MKRKPKDQRTIPVERPKESDEIAPDEIAIDVDDAMIEDPKDDAFEKDPKRKGQPAEQSPKERKKAG
ncbi:MAG TPA: hypothetical protein VGN17_07910 [Bryobacteraceae bacterium]|jgi:hypothetical protein